MATLYSSGASTPDATESTAGKLRIATDAERIAGTNDTTAMTPLKVAEAIAASSGGVTGALVYRGSYDASTATPDLTTASKGDFYIVSAAGALDAVALHSGDHLVFNQDATSPVTSAMFDKIDSTDAITSVNGQTGVVSLTASDVGALATGDNVSALTNDAGYITSAPVSSVNSLTGAVNLTAADVGALATGDNVSALTNDAGYITSAPVSSVNTLTGAVNLTAADVGALATGDNVSALTNDAGYITSAPVSSVNSLTGAVNLTAADVGALATGDNVSALTNDAGYLTSTLSADIIVDADGAYDLGTESARLGLTFSDLDGAVTFKASNASGAQITKGQPVYIAGVSGDVPTVALADADAAAMPCAGLAAETANSGSAIRIVSFGNLTDVDTSAFSLGDTLYIDTTAGALTATPPAGETAKLQNIGRVVRVHATSGIIKVGGAGRSAATPNLDEDKIFLGDSNNRAVSTALSAVALSSFNNDLGLATVATTGAYSDLSGTPTLATVATTGAYSDLSGTPTLGTAAALDAGTSASNVVQLDGSARLPAVDGSLLTNLPSGATELNDLSDVSFTAGAGIDNYVLTYDHGTSSWGAEAAGGGGGYAVDVDPTSITTTNPTLTAPSVDHEYYIVQNGASAITINLIAAATCGAGFQYTFKVLGTGAVTIDPNGSEYIDHSGQSTYVPAQYDAVSLLCDGSNWYLV